MRYLVIITGKLFLGRLLRVSKVKVKVTSPWKSEIRPFSKTIPPPFIMVAGKWPRIFKLGHNT